MNLIKMNVLPRLLYPMQMLPLYITKKIARETVWDVSKFVCNGKKPRLSMKILQLPKERGCVAFPNTMYYNWACHSRPIREWVHFYLKEIRSMEMFSPLIVSGAHKYGEATPWIGK